jgi:hypothetical protein
MLRNLLLCASIVAVSFGCASSARQESKKEANNNTVETIPSPAPDQPAIAPDLVPTSLNELPATQNGGFVLKPGFYEAEFRTYCLQPGTPDPSPRDAYLQAPMTGYRKEMVQTVLNNSRIKSDIPQRHVQLLLWNIVSGSDFERLSPSVKADASRLLSSKQIFELKGGVVGLMKTVAYNIPGNSGTDIRRLFDLGTSSYEAYERLAVLREPSRLKRADFKNDEWYKQKQNFYVRHFPVSYQKVKIQVYVPDGLVDSTGKYNGEYLVFDPTGYQTIPANSDAQRLGIGGPFIDVVRKVIIIANPGTGNPKKIEPKSNPKGKPAA